MKQRLSLPVLRRDGSGEARTVWLHAASLGECKLLCRFVGLLHEKHPDDRYVATATTRTGLEYLREHCPPVVLGVGYLPLDTVGMMKRMLVRCGVERVWLMETELWPSMLWACMRAGVPVGMANARLEERSARRMRALRPFLGPLFSSLDIVLAQDETYAERFRNLGVAQDRVRVAGNLKSRVLVENLDPDARLQMRQRMSLPNDAVVIAAGCVHPGEGSVIREALDLLGRDGMTCRCIVIPRHREAAQAVADELGNGVLRLADTKADGDWTVCVVERYGVLEDMYGVADVAFVGGTFVRVGGHNVWEAARQGIPVLFGPFHHTQQQSCDRLREAMVGFMVSDARSMADTVSHLLGKGRAAFADARDELAARLSREAMAVCSYLP
jgi:3-deoxy-D-manno-octulosonic-acid transferase